MIAIILLKFDSSINSNNNDYHNNNENDSSSSSSQHSPSRLACVLIEMK
jgi:hypothetical protein